MNGVSIIIISLLCFFFGISWLVLAYVNIKQQDGYLSPFTKCDFKSGTCEVVRIRNMYISKALRALNCPTLGWENWGPKKVTAECKNRDKGIATWVSTICMIFLSVVFAFILFYNVSLKINNFNLIYVYSLLVLIFVSTVGMLYVPYGSGNDSFSETHHSAKGHLAIAITGFAAMVLILIYTSHMFSKNNKKGVSITLMIIYILIVILLSGSLYAERIVDGGKPGQETYDSYLKSQKTRNILDFVFELGENMPVFLFFMSMIIIGVAIM